SVNVFIHSINVINYFINKKVSVRNLFEPEAFHAGNYTEIAQQCACPSDILTHPRLFRLGG
ncbi:MAG: hypothetical protein VX261_00315, partial [Candidatus Neomarinimicrobiota bacterium]|nr:hypothetical protein [Candidatus Neomarinimicrobiota bacterium]